MSVRLEQLGSNWMDFHEIWHLSIIFRKICGENVNNCPTRCYHVQYYISANSYACFGWCLHPSSAACVNCNCSIWHRSSHLVGQLLTLIHDVRTHEHKKPMEKLHVSCLTRITSTVHEDPYTLLIISRSVLLRMRNVSDRSCRGIQNTFYIQKHFFPENRAVYEIMWKNIIDPDRPQMT